MTCNSLCIFLTISYFDYGNVNLFDNNTYIVSALYRLKLVVVSTGLEGVKHALVI